MYQPTWDGIKEYINTVQQKGIIDHIVIHLTVLEKLVGTQEDKIEERIKDKIKILRGEGIEGDNIKFKKKPLSVSVCTGRGKSINDVKIIPFSELEKWICSPESSKYHLCQCLNN